MKLLFATYLMWMSACSALECDTLGTVCPHKLPSVCQCSSDPLSLKCNGPDSFHSAKSVIQSYPGVAFVELTISSDDIPVLTDNDLRHFTCIKNLFLPANNISLLYEVNNELTKSKRGPFHNLTNLQNLSLANNCISFIDSTAFDGMTELLTLDLSNNKLRTLNENVFKGNKKLDKVNLTGNPWNCNEAMFPLSAWLKDHEVNREGSLCNEPPHVHNTTLQNGLEILFLERSIQESPTCNATMCNCTITRDKEIISMDCSNRGMTKLPETVPNKTRVINLRGNNIKSLTIDHLDTARWSSISFLHLNNNLIDSLKGLEGTWLVRNLVALHLTNNQLTEIPVHILEQLRGGLLDELYLSGNPWNCDCNTVRFQTWLQDNYKTVKDFDGIRCSPASGTYSNQPIYRLMKSQLCPQDANPVHFLDILNSLMAIAIFLVVFKLSYDYWLQKRTGKLPRFFSLNLK